MEKILIQFKQGSAQTFWPQNLGDCVTLQQQIDMFNVSRIYVYYKACYV